MSRLLGELRIESYKSGGRRPLEVESGDRAEKEHAANAHHVTFDKVKPERHLLNTFVNAVDTLFGIREDNVGFLVVACQHALFQICLRQLPAPNENE